jgi:hypothetical protein
MGVCQGLWAAVSTSRTRMPLRALPERVAVDRVAVAEKIGWRRVVREGLHDLLGRPGCGGVLGHVAMDDLPAMVGEHDEDEEHPQARGGDREEIEGDQVPEVVGEERAPGLGRQGVPHAWAGISGGPETALTGRDRARSGQGVQSPPPPAAPPTRRGQGRRVRPPSGEGKPSRPGNRRISLKNLKARPQLLE